MKYNRECNFRRLVWLFTITYIVSYITRINYGAVISEMIQYTGFSKAMLSMAVTGSFVTYGAGQIISGMLGDKFSPKRLALYGLSITSMMNLFIPVCRNPYQMLVVWCINGLAQAFMWPPIVKLMTALFSEEEYKSATVKVVSGSSVGTIIVYLISPFLILICNWKLVFIFSAACGIVMSIVWHKYCPDIKVDVSRVSGNSIKATDLRYLFTPVMLAIMSAIIIMGMLRDGVTTWMPSYISESYGLENKISIITGVLMPLFSIASIQLSAKLYKNCLKNPVVCAAIMFATGVLANLIIVLLDGSSVVVAILLTAVLIACMHGVNLMLVCMIPPFFERYGRSSTVSGILNAYVYIGSAISTYGIAVLSQGFGWDFTLMAWLVAGTLGTLICIFSASSWRKKYFVDNDI